MIKALEIKPSIVFYEAFANNTVLSCIFFFLLIIDLCLLVSAVNPQIFIPIKDLALPNATNVEMCFNTSTDTRNENKTMFKIN